MYSTWYVLYCTVLYSYSYTPTRDEYLYRYRYLLYVWVFSGRAGGKGKSERQYIVPTPHKEVIKLRIKFTKLQGTVDVPLTFKIQKRDDRGMMRDRGSTHTSQHRASSTMHVRFLTCFPAKIGRRGNLESLISFHFYH